MRLSRWRVDERLEGSSERWRLTVGPGHAAKTSTMVEAIASRAPIDIGGGEGKAIEEYWSRKFR
jgi:hypothetical protein